MSPIKDHKGFIKKCAKVDKWEELNVSLKNKATAYCFYLSKTPSFPYSYSGWLKILKLVKSVDNTLGLISDKKSKQALRVWYNETYINERLYKTESPLKFEYLYALILEGNSREQLINRNRKEYLSNKRKRGKSIIDNRTKMMVKTQYRA